MKNLCSLSFWLLVFSTIIFNSVDGQDWGYKNNANFKGPNNWKSISGASCGGRRQSPIDIVSENVQYWSGLSPLNINDDNSATTQVSLSKEPMTLKLDFSEKWKFQFGNTTCLKPVAIHWHWGSVDSRGSEHSINGRFFPIEGHLVSYNCELYQNFNTAFGSASGLYVIGLFYEIGENNTAINKLTNVFDNLIKTNPLTVSEISPKDFLPKNLNRYYRYEGSLTTPLCTENVIWTIMDEKLSIGKAQLEKFRSLTFSSPDSGPMVDNYRPTIPMRDSIDFFKRVVYSSFSSDSRILKNLLCLNYFMLILIVIVNF